MIGNLSAWTIVESKAPTMKKKSLNKDEHSPTKEKMIASNKFESLKEGSKKLVEENCNDPKRLIH